MMLSLTMHVDPRQQTTKGTNSSSMKIGGDRNYQAPRYANPSSTEIGLNGTFTQDKIVIPT
jgi:hypothetical protein